jgi:hypothetical protein
MLGAFQFSPKFEFEYAPWYDKSNDYDDD